MFCIKCGTQVKDGEQLCAACAGKESAKPADKRKKLILLCVGALAVIAALAFRGGLFTGAGKPEIVVYLKDSEYYYVQGKEKPRQLTDKLLRGDLGERFGQSLMESPPYIAVTQDGKAAFFRDRMDNNDSNSLYYKRLETEKAESQKIDSDVESWEVNNTGDKVFYLKENDFYQHNLTDKTRIASDVSRFCLNDSGSALLYINTDRELYLKADNKDREKIDSDIQDIIRVSDDLSQVVYIKDGSLYQKPDGKDKERLAADVVWAAAFATGEAYFTKTVKTTKKLADFLEDDLKDRDAALTAPSAPPEPEIDDFRGQSWNDYYAAWERYYKDYALYEGQRNQYHAKEERDRLREQVKTEEIELDEQELYYFNGKEAVKISDGFSYLSQIRKVDARAVLLYQKAAAAGDKIKISETADLQRLRQAAARREAQPGAAEVAIKGKVFVIGHDKGEQFELNRTGTGIYYIDDYPDKGQKKFTEVPITGDTLGQPATHADNVYSYIARGDDCILFKDVKDGEGDIYLGKTMIAADVSIYGIRFLGEYGAASYDPAYRRQDFAFFTDYDSDKDRGTLNVYSGKKIKIADDVYGDYRLIGDKGVAYLRDYNNDRHRGDLYLYTGEEEQTRIDIDVNNTVPVFPINTAKPGRENFVAGA